MDHDLLDVKLNQLVHVLRETEGWLTVPSEEFGRDTKLVRACQRNLQLLVEYASDINGILVLELGTKVPGSYRESFAAVFAMDVVTGLSVEDRAALFASVDWRNDLIHEYEPAESNDVFYTRLKEFLTAYRNYAAGIHHRFSPAS
jgi:uncharacterized protein YutE (UPF0331/DUF86 family)